MNHMTQKALSDKYGNIPNFIPLTSIKPTSKRIDNRYALRRWGFAGRLFRTVLDVKLFHSVQATVRISTVPSAETRSVTVNCYDRRGNNRYILPKYEPLNNTRTLESRGQDRKI